MSDNEQKPKREEAHLYVKLPKEKLVEFDVKVAERQIKRPQALAEAVKLWLKHGGKEPEIVIDFTENPRYYSEQVLKAVQKASQAISLIEESITLLESSKDVKSENGDEQPVDELGKIIDDATRKAEDLIREADLLKEELLRSEGKGRKRK